VFTDVVQVWMILVLAFLLGIANAVDMPVRQAFSIELVGREDIGNAVALNSAMFNGARVVGPALAGLAIAAFGVGPAFAINAVSFLAVIIGLRLMDDEALHVPNRIARPDSARAVVRNLKEGLHYVRGTPIVLRGVTTVGVVATVGMNFNVLIPAFAQNDLQSGAAGYGFLMAASGVGSLLAAVRLVIGGRPRAVRLATGALILGVASLALAVPDHLRGRVMSVYTTVFSASVPIGGLAMGAVASAFGAPIAIALGGALSLLAGVGAWAWGRSGAFDSVGGPAPSNPTGGMVPGGAHPR